MTHDIIVGGVFTVPYKSIIPHTPPYEQEWEIAVGKSGNIWLYRTGDSNVWQSGGNGSRGCGGSTLVFKLANGLGEIHLKGPWNSNSEAFFRDTGIDVRMNHLTWGVVGTGRAYDENSNTHKITGVVWFDPEPVRGDFERVDLLAWDMQLQNPDTPLFCYRESEGGASNGPVTMPYKTRVALGLQKPIEEVMGW